MIKKSFFLLSVLIFAIVFSANSQEGGVLSFSLIPGVNIPLGASKDRYTLGGGGELKGEYTLPFFPHAHALVSINYNLIPTTTQKNVNTVSLGTGPGISYSIIPRLSLGTSVEGGYFAAIYSNRYAFNPYFQVNSRITYNFVPSFSIGAGASYKHYFGGSEPFFQGIGAYASATLRPGRTKRAEIKIREIKIKPVFPVFFKYYDKNPLGTIVLQNKEKGTIKDVKVSLFVKQYMNSPTESVLLREMRRDEEKEISLYALFTDGVLDITEKTKVQADIMVEYKFQNETLSLKQTETMRLHDRNAITWDDDRKTAAFVTAKDPTILRFSKKISGLVRERGAPAIDDNLLIAMGLHEALTLFGMTYVPDPSTPYIEYSTNTAAVDFIQFPNQTLQYKAGDCDDLSILYNALLESVGVETAFITAPGHIFTAFSIDVSPEEILRYFNRPQDLVVMEDKVWIPVEITSIGGGFMKAWQIAAKEWREFHPKGEAGFFSTHASWDIYEAVGFQAPPEQTELPEEKKVLERFTVERQKFVDGEVLPRVEEYREKLKKTPGDPRYVNQLGTIYAKYGLYSEAEKHYKAAISSDNYLSSIVNLGNVHFMKGDVNNALEYYQRALQVKPKHALILLNMAVAYYELENYEEALRYYTQAWEIDPDRAARYKYLEASEKGGPRASKTERSRVDWDEEL